MAIPVAVFGQNPAVAQGVAESMKPEYETVHISLTLPTALSELPPLFAGITSTPPASGLGSNIESPAPQVPKVLIFGAGVPADEVAAVTDAIKEKVPDVKCVSVTKEEVLAAGGGPGGQGGPNAGVVGGLLKGKIAALEE